LLCPEKYYLGLTGNIQTIFTGSNVSAAFRVLES
jgi:hypothetical protein